MVSNVICVPGVAADTAKPGGTVPDAPGLATSTRLVNADAGGAGW